MNIGYLEVSCPIISLSVNVAIQILSCRFFSRSGLLKTIYLGFISGLTSLALFEFYLFFKSVASNFIVYTALSYCYFHFINLGETARRIRILRELSDSDSGLSEDQILQRYNAGQIIKARIERLLNNHQLILKNNKYYVDNPTMLFLARIIKFMKVLLFSKTKNSFV